MQIYTAVDINPMGEFSEQFGQTYWGEVKEIEVPVRFNLMNPTNVMPGQQLVAQESARPPGKNYMQLRKVKLSESQQAVAPLAQPLEEAQDKVSGYEKAIEARKALEKPAQTQPVGRIVLPSDEKPSYEAGTNARWALKLSTETYKTVVGGMPDQTSDWTAIEDMAKFLLEAFDRLKNYTPESEE